MWQTLSWMVNKTASFLWETGKQIVQTGVAHLRPLTTLASLVATEIIWHQVVTPAAEDSPWLDEHESVKAAIPFVYYGLVTSVYCAFHPQHLKGFVQGLTQHLYPSGLIKAYQQFSAPIYQISKQTTLYIVMPALVWQFAVHPTLRAITPDAHQWPLRLIQGTFWILWQRPTRLLFSAGFNEYYHTGIAKGLYLSTDGQPVSVTPFDQTQTFRELGRMIPIPAAHVIYHYSKSKPIIKKEPNTGQRQQAAGKNQGLSDYIRMALTLVKRLVGYVLLIGVTEVTPYINYFTPIMELLLRGITLGYVDLDIVFTNTHAEVLYLCMLAYLYSYSTHEYYFSTLGHSATDQAIIMAENPAFHLAYGLPMAAAEYYLVMKGMAGLDSEIIYGLLFFYFPIMMIQAQFSAREQHQRSSKTDHWIYYLMPFYMPFQMSGRIVNKTLEWLVSSHKNKKIDDTKMPAPPSISDTRHTLRQRATDHTGLTLTDTLQQPRLTELQPHEERLQSARRQDPMANAGSTDGQQRSIKQDAAKPVTPKGTQEILASRPPETQQRRIQQHSAKPVQPPAHTKGTATNSVQLDRIMTDMELALREPPPALTPRRAAMLGDTKHPSAHAHTEKLRSSTQQDRQASSHPLPSQDPDLSDWVCVEGATHARRTTQAAGAKKLTM